MQSDCNIWLYDPNGKKVAEATYYGDDSLSYPADMGGTWKIKIDMFPGFDEKWDEYPVPYYQYGSGAYEFTLSIGGSASLPPVVPQPEITPVAQTFVVSNDDTSNKDEYAYISAVPAANYIENGKRYVSPVVYEGDDTVTNWFGTVDDTTNYLLEDWNEYLSHFGKEAKVYNLDSEPVKASANIATMAWDSSDEAVVAIDGSNVEDNVKEVISKQDTLNIRKKVMQISGNSEKLQEFENNLVYPFFAGRKWGIIHIEFTETKGRNYEASLITPNYMEGATDWWPDGEDKTDIWHPVILPGPYGVVTTSKGDYNIKTTLYSCNRYKIPVTNSGDIILKIRQNSLLKNLQSNTSHPQVQIAST